MPRLLPLQISLAAAFAVASLMAMLAIVTLVLKTFVEWRVARQALPVDDFPFGEL